MRATVVFGSFNSFETTNTNVYCLSRRSEVTKVE